MPIVNLYNLQSKQARGSSGSHTQQDLTYRYYTGSRGPAPGFELPVRTRRVRHREPPSSSPPPLQPPSSPPKKKHLNQY